MERVKTLRKPKIESYIDYSLVFIVLFLLAFGLVMLYSTSSYEANLDYGDSAYYFKHQLGPTIIGLGAIQDIKKICISYLCNSIVFTSFAYSFR